MTCAGVDRLLAEGLEPQSIMTSAASHMASCTRCRDLVEWAGKPLPAPGSLSGRSIARQLAADLRPVRSIPSDGTLAGMLIAGALMIAAGFLISMGTRGLEAMGPAQSAGVAVVLLGAAAYLAVGVPPLLRPGARRPRHLAACLGALILGYPLVAILLFPMGPSAHFIQDGARCLAAGLVTSLLTAAAASLVTRFGYVLNPLLTAPVIAGFGAAVSLIVLQVFCPDQEAAHLAVWHALVIAVMISTGLIAGRLIRGRLA